MTLDKTIVIGTRSSELAMWQANHAADAIRERYPEKTVKILGIMTKGDKILDTPLARIGGKGLFTNELEASLLRGEIDMAVHSLKDVPAVLPDGLKISAIMKREDAHDVLVSSKYRTFQSLPNGAKIGTSSLRRGAQLLHARGDLHICSLRGNVNTRLRKLEEDHFDAIILAKAGLIRLGLAERVTEVLPFDLCLPAAGQGVMVIETRDNDKKTEETIRFLHHEQTAQAVAAERAFLVRVEGSCQVPVGIHAQISGKHISADAVIASLDGVRFIRDHEEGNTAEAADVGNGLAQKILDEGGLAIMRELGLLES